MAQVPSIPKDKATAEAIIRALAKEYLEKPGINSIGFGYKETDGKTTDQICIQFSVDQKVQPESLDEGQEIPGEVEVLGHKFPTDVVQRKFEQHSLLQKSPRKKRVDPIYPGVSMAHVKGTAGTLAWEECLLGFMASSFLMSSVNAS